MKNKRGDVPWYLLAIILVVIVLVILAVGFVGSWKTLWSRMNVFGGSSEDVQTVIEACQLACAKQSTYSFCKKSWTIKEGDAEKRIVTCEKLYSEQGLGGCESIPSCSEYVVEESPETP